MSMKINPINLYTTNYVSQNQSESKSVQNIPNKQFDYCLSEAFGRSQVNFTSKKPENDLTKAFINSLSNDLELSDSQTINLKRICNRFLKENNAISIYEFIEDEDTSKLCSFVETIVDTLDLTEEGTDKLIDKLYSYKALNSLFQQAQDDDALCRLLAEKMAETFEDAALTDKLVEVLNIDPKDEKFISSKLKKARNHNITPEQTAYELIEEYDLTSEDYRFIKETIKETDGTDILSRFIEDCLKENEED